MRLLREYIQEILTEGGISSGSGGEEQTGGSVKVKFSGILKLISEITIKRVGNGNAKFSFFFFARWRGRVFLQGAVSHEKGESTYQQVQRWYFLKN